MKRYIALEKPEFSDRGCNMAVEVYQLVRGDFPRIVGAKYDINTASWKGTEAVAAEIIREKHGHIHDGYRPISKDVDIRKL
jgi:hypothetical protein